MIKDEERDEELSQPRDLKYWSIPGSFKNFGDKSPEEYLSDIEENCPELWDQVEHATILLENIKRVRRELIESAKEELEVVAQKVRGQSLEELYLWQAKFDAAYAIEKEIQRLEEVCCEVFASEPQTLEQAKALLHATPQEKIRGYLNLIEKTSGIPEEYQREIQGIKELWEGTAQKILEKSIESHVLLSIHGKLTGEVSLQVEDKNLSDERKIEMGQLREKLISVEKKLRRHHGLENYIEPVASFIRVKGEQAALLEPRHDTCTPIHWTGTKADCKRVFNGLIDHNLIQAKRLNIFLSEHIRVKGKQLTPEQWGKADGNLHRSRNKELLKKLIPDR